MDEATKRDLHFQRRLLVVDVRKITKIARSEDRCWYIGCANMPIFWVGPAPEPMLEVPMCLACTERQVAHTWNLAQRHALDLRETA